MTLQPPQPPQTKKGNLGTILWIGLGLAGAVGLVWFTEDCKKNRERAENIAKREDAKAAKAQVQKDEALAQSVCARGVARLQSSCAGAKKFRPDSCAEGARTMEDVIAKIESASPFTFPVDQQWVLLPDGDVVPVNGSAQAICPDMVPAVTWLTLQEMIDQQSE